jgi:hypothetical protein
MGRRSRSSRGGRGRRAASPGMLVAFLVFRRSTWVQFFVFWRACRSHPLTAFAVLTWFSVWVGSGSGLVAMVVTPWLFASGAAAWFWWRMRRTGLGVRDSADQLRRQRRVRQQWALACEEAGLHRVPPLPPWRVRSEGDTVVARFDASAAGLSHDPILSGLKAMQEVVGRGCRDARMKALGNSGLVEIRFAWGDPLGKVITPNMLPTARKGMAVFGVAESGSPVGFKILNDRGECTLLPTLITGRSGSGKSSTGWSKLLGLILMRSPSTSSSSTSSSGAPTSSRRGRTGPWGR